MSKRYEWHWYFLWFPMDFRKQGVKWLQWIECKKERHDPLLFDAPDWYCEQWSYRLNSTSAPMTVGYSPFYK